MDRLTLLKEKLSREKKYLEAGMKLKSSVTSTDNKPLQMQTEAITKRRIAFYEKKIAEAYQMSPEKLTITFSSCVAEILISVPIVWYSDHSKSKRNEIKSYSMYVEVSDEVQISGSELIDVDPNQNKFYDLNVKLDYVNPASTVMVTLLVTDNTSSASKKKVSLKKVSAGSSVDDEDIFVPVYLTVTELKSINHIPKSFATKIDPPQNFGYIFNSITHLGLELKLYQGHYCKSSAYKTKILRIKMLENGEFQRLELTDYMKHNWLYLVIRSGHLNFYTDHLLSNIVDFIRIDLSDIEKFMISKEDDKLMIIGKGIKLTLEFESKDVMNLATKFLREFKKLASDWGCELFNSTIMHPFHWIEDMESNPRAFLDKIDDASKFFVSDAVHTIHKLP